MGRLIDCDVLCERLLHAWDCFDKEKKKDISRIMADVVTPIVVGTPTAEERKTGEWIHAPNGIDRDFVWWKCSECGHEIYSETEKDREEFHVYCGRCGAKMMR